MEAESPLSVFDSVKVANLRPGDVVLLRCDAKLNDKQRAVVIDMLNEVFPNHESVILDGGQDIAVLRPEPGMLGRMFGRAKGVRDGSRD
jgi:hypothetical protein